jgi:peptide/nickel transport system permease protein
LYVDALRALGIGKVRIILRHIIPNTIYPVIVQCTLDLGGVILTFAGLSFLGFGTSALTPELGRLITAGQTYIFQAPWLTAFPGLTILIISLAFNLMGDGIRDVLDPRLRR